MNPIDNLDNVPRTVHGLVRACAAAAPDAPAIEGVARTPLSYAALVLLIERTHAALRALGIDRNDSVAVVLPNGPEMATAFLAISSAATCAPLNPQYRDSEFDFYLSDLSAKALVLERGSDSPAHAVAAARGIPVFELVPDSAAPAGTFALSSSVEARPSSDGFAEPGDVALVLHTSGTTSRPKMVPLTHANLSVSARNVARALALTESDRCLNIMPLFHIHGLIGALLSSLSEGAAVTCSPGFLAPSFFEWVNACAPTWYTAVPTMHRAILSRTEANRAIVEKRRLRLIRSCSAALPPQLMAEMESAFGCPVIESYGMTEASHQMASNPLPPRARKPGSVGVAAGPDVAIMDEKGTLLSTGQRGEIVIRGANVTSGYANNPKANESSFTDGWFRTGDEGYLDPEGYLFLTGRIKEMINRGGEKIAPREIDEVLLNHPSVLQALAFAVPDQSLGEEVAAAVVLREGASASEREIQEFAASRLADFKVPRKIVFLKDIPKGPTGKLQRIGLAEKLGIQSVSPEKPSAKAEYVAPRNAAEETLARIWAAELKLPRVGVLDDFFALGGDSMTAARIFNAMEKNLGVRLPLTTLLDSTTIEGHAGILSDKSRSQAVSPVVAIKKDGSRPPLFCMAAWDSYLFVHLARRMDKDQPLYGIHAQGLIALDHPKVEIPALARQYLELVRSVQPHGPYLLAGECSSGYTAFEVSRLLRADGEDVALLVLFDTPGPWGLSDRMIPLKERITRFASHLYTHAINVSKLPSGKRLGYVGGVLKGYARRIASLFGAKTPPPQRLPYQIVGEAVMRARTTYAPEPVDVDILMYVTPEYSRRPGSGKVLRWRDYTTKTSEVHEVRCGHDDLLREPNVREVASILNKRLASPRPSAT